VRVIVAGTEVPGLLVSTTTTPGQAPAPGVTAVYVRVSSTDQQADWDRQVARVAKWAAREGLAVGRGVRGRFSAEWETEEVPGPTA